LRNKPRTRVRGNAVLGKVYWVGGFIGGLLSNTAGTQ